MFKKISAVSALLLLAACECGTDTCQKVDTATAVTPGTAADFKQNIRDRAFFGFDSAKLQPSAEEVLKQQAAWLKVHNATTASVTGHCDSRGSAEYNLALGQKRAQAAADCLAHCGVEKTRLKTVSYGKEQQPVPNATTEEQHAQNRVAVTVIN